MGYRWKCVEHDQILRGTRDLWLSLEAFPPDWLIVSLLSHLNHAVSGFSVVFRET